MDKMKQSNKKIHPPSFPLSLLLILMLLILQQPNSAFANTNNTDSKKSNTAVFAWISDLHYDPFYGGKDAYSYSTTVCGIDPRIHYDSNTTNVTKKVVSRGKYGCDSPSSIIEMTLLAVKNKLQKYHSPTNEVNDVILITGDLVRHSTDKLPNPKKSMSEILSYLAKLLRFTFPNPSNIIPAIGNNDVTPDNYLDVDLLTQKQEMEEENEENGEPEEETLPQEEIGTQMEETGLDILYKAFQNVLITDEEEKISFQNNGYYMRKIDNTNINVMVLNTIIYSPFHKPTINVQYDEKDPLKQFAWMEGQLHNLQYQNSHNLNEKKVCWIVGHIPPTIGSYRKTQLWKDSYLIQYHRLIDKYKDVVVTQLFGHIHSDEFRLISPNSTMLGMATDTANDTEAAPAALFPTPPILLQGSVTPVFGSNPNFRIVTYDTVTGSILDYDVYYINIEEGSTSTWEKLYSFKEYYSIDEDGDVSTPILESIYSRMKYESGENAFQTTLLDKFLDVHYSKPKPKFIRDEEDEMGEDFEYGTEEEECKDECKTEWMCTLISMTRKDYDNCVSPPTTTTTMQPEQSDESNKNSTNHVRFIFLALACGMFLFFFCAGTCCQAYRRRTPRRQYEDVANEFNLDANDLTLYERQGSSSSSVEGAGGGSKGRSNIEGTGDFTSKGGHQKEEDFENEEDSQKHRNQQMMLSDDMELL